ncbi:AP-2 complex subunit mu [Clarias magur]|uniref:AP-2 complex subunit mu n=1 Tax=Clarias magur TaxID=1594786 RepID=A0A8J4XHD6_CLAMG|nr:AP-2 complex subunit mu [Clarias magur]
MADRTWQLRNATVAHKFTMALSFKLLKDRQAANTTNQQHWAKPEHWAKSSRQPQTCTQAGD